VILPINLSAPGGFNLILMSEADYLKDTASHAYHGAFDFLINVGHALDKRWTFYTELFTTQSLQAGQEPIYTLDEALTCALGPNLQLDFGGNFSVSDVPPREQLYIGLSQRFCCSYRSATAILSSASASNLTLKSRTRRRFP
jgi:Putative MetA-pathway of phenol degradation